MVVGAVVFTLMSTWRRGRQLLIERTSEDNPPLARFIAELDPSRMPRVRGTAIYLANHVMLDQPLAFVAALRMLLDNWMRNESAKGSG